MWALALLLVAAVLALAPVYLVGAAQSGPDQFRFFEPSAGWAREILAAVHLLFLLGVLGLTVFTGGERLASRLTGLAAWLGLLEIGLAAGAVWFLGDGPRFAPPEMTVAALGALLLLGGIGLNLDALLSKALSPKAPVVLVYAVALPLAALGFALIGSLSARHYARVDYTRAGRYKLPEPTIELLGKLNRSVRISTLFFMEDVADDVLRREVTAILDEYERLSPRIQVDHLDLRREGDVKPAKALERRLKARGLKLQKNAVFLECAETGRVVAVPSHELLEAAPASHSGGLPSAASAADASNAAFRFMGDAVFHRALATVTERRPLTLYFVVGHGEKPNSVGPPSPLVKPEVRKQLVEIMSIRLLEEGLRRQYFRLKTLDLDDLGSDEGIPADCDVLVIAGPWCSHIVRTWPPQALAPFSARHASVVRSYLERGGRALVMLDPTGAHYRPKIEPLLAMLRRYGIEVDVDSVVADDRVVRRTVRLGQEVEQAEPSSLFFADFIQEYRPPHADPEAPAELHPSIRALRERPILAVESSEIHTASVPGFRSTRLLTSSANAWVQPLPPPGQPMAEVKQKERRRRVVAVAVEDEQTGAPVMVVVGSSNMFVAQMIRFGKVANNEEFAHKTLAWLTGNTQLLAVQPRAARSAYGKADASAIRTVRFVSVFVLPSIFVLAGAVVWLGRRN